MHILSTVTKQKRNRCAKIFPRACLSAIIQITSKWVGIVAWRYSTNYISTAKSIGSIKAVLPEICINWKITLRQHSPRGTFSCWGPVLSATQVREEWGGLCGVVHAGEGLLSPIQKVSSPSISLMYRALKNLGSIVENRQTPGFAVNKKLKLMLSLKLYCFFGIGGGV